MAQHKIIDRYEVVVENDSGEIIARALRSSIGGDWIITYQQVNIDGVSTVVLATISADRVPEVLQRKTVLAALSVFEDGE